MTDLLDRIRELDPAHDADLPELSIQAVLERTALRNAEPTRSRRRTLALAAGVAAVLLMIGLATQRRSDRGTAASSRIVATVFLVPDASPDIVEQVGQRLVRLGFDVRYKDKQAAPEEFRRLFPDSPELEKAFADQDMLPTSYDLSGHSTDGRPITEVADEIKGWPGILSIQVVTDPPEAVGGAMTTPVETSRTDG